MKIYMFFPIWEIEKIEEKLKKMEQDGKRLKSVMFSYCFYFEEAKPKNATYVITYNMANDNRPDMYSLESLLLSRYPANRIKTTFTGYNIFRVTEKKVEDDELTGRKKYIKHVMFQYLFIAIFCFIIGVFLLWASQTNPSKVFAMLFLGCSAIAIIYRLYGFIALKKQQKKQK